MTDATSPPRARVELVPIENAPGCYWARLWFGDALLRAVQVQSFYNGSAGPEHPAIARLRENARLINQAIEASAADLQAANARAEAAEAALRALLAVVDAADLDLADGGVNEDQYQAARRQAREVLGVDQP